MSEEKKGCTCNFVEQAWLDFRDATLDRSRMSPSDVYEAKKVLFAGALTTRNLVAKGIHEEQFDPLMTAIDTELVRFMDEVTEKLNAETSKLIMPGSMARN